jgi:hypothetical protein
MCLSNRQSNSWLCLEDVSPTDISDKLWSSLILAWIIPLQSDASFRAETYLRVAHNM